MIEEKEYIVSFVVLLTTTVSFAPIDRDKPITIEDAIANGIGSLPYDFVDYLHGEGFGVVLPVSGVGVPT